MFTFILKGPGHIWSGFRYDTETGWNETASRWFGYRDTVWVTQILIVSRNSLPLALK